MWKIIIAICIISSTSSCSNQKPVDNFKENALFSFKNYVPSFPDSAFKGNLIRIFADC